MNTAEPFTWNLDPEQEPNYAPIKSLIASAYEQILIPPDSVRLSWWKKLDHALGGLRPREYTIFCGPTGAGKTAFLAALAAQLAKADVPTYVASVETGRVDFVVRMISSVARQNWNLGEPIDVRHMERFREEHPWFDQAPFYLARYDDRVPNEELLNDIKHAVDAHGVKIAILDNLNFFMEVTTEKNSVLEMDRVVHEAIIFCKQIDVHLIVVMHPRKTENGRVDNEFEIKGSSTAVQEAHNVLLFNRLAKDAVEANPSLRNHRDILIAKCRRRGFGVGKKICFVSRDGVSFDETEL